MEDKYTVEFNPNFKMATYIVLGLLLLYNLLVLARTRDLFEFVPIFFETDILLAVSMNKYVAKVLIKIWAVLMMLTGGLPTLAFLLWYLARLMGGSPTQVVKIVPSEIPFRVIEVVVGIVFFIYTNRSITKDETQPAQNVV